MTFERTLASLNGTPWALADGTVPALRDLMRAEARGENLSGRLATIGGSSRSTAPSQGTVAVIPVAGLITQRIDWVGTSTSWVSTMLARAMSDPGCAGVVLAVDSPGGTVSGTPELADEIFRARSRKPIVSFVDPYAASAAFWIASQAHEMMITRSGSAGSVGVLWVHMDVSGAFEQDGIRPTIIKAGRYKTETSPFAPLSEEAKAFQQGQVDQFYGEFVAAVARGRDVSVAKVKADFGQGRCLLAGDCVRLGMVDRIGTLLDAVGRVVALARPSSGASASLANRLRHGLVDDPAKTARHRRLAELAREPVTDTLASRARRKIALERHQD